MTRNPHYPSAPPPLDDDHQHRPAATSSSMPSRKPRSQMNASEKREDTKLMNRLKQRAYRQRLADTISSLSTENASLRSDAADAETLALFQASELKKQIVELKSMLEAQEKQVGKGSRGRAELNGSEFRVPHFSPDAISIITSDDLPSILTTPQDDSFLPDFLLQPPVHDFEYDTYASTYGIVVPEDVDEETGSPFIPYVNNIDHFQRLHPQITHFYPFAPPDSCYVSSTSISAPSSSSAPFHTLHQTSSSQPVFGSAAPHRLEYQNPSLDQGLVAVSSREPACYESSATAVHTGWTRMEEGWGGNFLGVSLGEMSAGSGYAVECNWEEVWDDQIRKEELVWDYGE